MKFNLKKELAKLGYGVDPPTPKFIRYKNLKKLAKKFWGEDVADGVGVGNNGETFSILDSIELAGFWGFTDTKSNIIRYWIKSFDKTLFFFGHEIGHMADIYSKHFKDNDDLSCEIRADLYAWVSQEALKITRHVSTHD